MTLKQAQQIVDDAHNEFEISGTVFSLTDFEEAVRTLTLAEEDPY